jgi:serine/threonine-protein kinase
MPKEDDGRKSGGKAPTPGPDAGNRTPRHVVRSDRVAAAADDTMLESADTAAREPRAAAGTPVAAADAPTSPDSDTVPSPEALIGQVLVGRYEITRKIGEGGMGVVYEATHRLIGKRVAVKVLLPKYAEKVQIIARLEQEARLASSIGHENIVDITDFGETHDARRFVVMEYLDGESLAACLAREGPLPIPRMVAICRQIASALGAAHKKGIIHRDIKPENVFLTRRGDRDFIKVVDFGISKSLRAADEEGADSPRLTQTGMVLGTPLYMSPEQARGDETLDHRIDVYALGVIMYELTTGEVPFRGSNYLHVISQVLSEEARSPRELRTDGAVTEAIEAIILKALAKDRDARYQTMEELDADLAALQTDRQVGAVSGSFWASRKRALRKRSPVAVAIWIAAIGVVIAGVAVAVALLARSGAERPAVEPPLAAAQLDASVAAAPDAGPAAAPLERVAIQLDSEPRGANIYADGGGKLLGQTPYTWRTLKRNEPVTLIFEKKGHDETSIQINPYTDDYQPWVVRLPRTKQGAAARRLRTVTRPDAPERRASGGDDTTGGELLGNPVRQKKQKKKPDERDPDDADGDAEKRR